MSEQLFAAASIFLAVVGSGLAVHQIASRLFGQTEESAQLTSISCALLIGLVLVGAA